MDRNNAMQIIIIVADTVALRKESVDRNTHNTQAMKGGIMSLSARRAWIEIDVTAKTGLFTSVALRKESVDRNCPGAPCTMAYWPSLSARRAWIEMRGSIRGKCECCVALRKESVDRNLSDSKNNTC